jgi:hypothetical protein
MDIDGWIYKNSFNSSAPSQNLLPLNIQFNEWQVIISILIDIASKYILIVTTEDQQTTEAFSIIVDGMGTVGFIVG